MVFCWEGKLFRLPLRQESRHTADHHGLGAVPGAAVQFAPVLDHLALRSGLCLCCDHHGQYLQKVSVISDQTGSGECGYSVSRDAMGTNSFMGLSVNGKKKSNDW